MGDSAVTTFWDAPNGGALTGTERFGADKAGSGDPADSPHYTADQIKAFALLGLTPAQIGAATAAESAAALAAAQGAQTTANDAASAAVAAQGTADNAVTAAATAQTTASNAATAASTAQTTANAALPKPGGTTTAGGIVLGTGTAGAAVEVSTTTLQFVLDSLTATYNLAAATEVIALDGRSPVVQATQTTATRTLLAADAGDIIPADPTSNAIEFTIPHTLFAAAGAGRAFKCAIVALNVTNAITLAGSGGLGLTYYGDSTITAGDIIRISVESATVCRVEVIKTGAGGGSGDLVGPGGPVTASGILTWDGTGGTDVQDSGVTVADLAKTTAITVYDTAGSGNYTIPTGAKAVWRRVIGAGGGGGGGGAGTGASTRSGGAGGGGGAVATGWISGAELAGGTIAYVVGAGGTSGAGTASGDGTDGGVGGQSSAGALIAYGGGGGRRGLTIGAVAGGGGGGGTGGPGTVGAAGAVAGGLPGASSAAAIGGQGAQGGTTVSACAEYGGGAGGGHNTSAFFPGGSSLYGGGGGGAGAGTNAFPNVNNPSAGGTSGTYTPGGGGAAGTSGASPTAGTAGAAADSTRCGSGGGGGGSTVTTNTTGAAGGAGGAGGGGGGGGGSGTNTGAGGAGGVGGAGRVEFYAFF